MAQTKAESPENSINPCLPPSLPPSLMDHENPSPPPQRRSICPTCDRPLPVCLCHALPQQRIPTATQLIIVQHPHESRHKLSTVPVLTKCLLNSTTIVARRLRPGLSPLLDTHPKAVYLFPSTPTCKAVRLDDLKSAIFKTKSSDLEKNLGSILETGLDPEFISRELSDPDENSSSTSETGLDPEFYSRESSTLSKLVLIAFDATWKHAKEMVSASEEYLSKFATRVCLDTDEGVDGASIYNSELVLRKEPFGGCVSTMEAVARCLRVVERNGVEIEGVLVGVLREMVRLQAGFLRPMKPRVKLVKRGR